mgnify:FL=1
MSLSGDRGTTIGRPFVQQSLADLVVVMHYLARFDRFSWQILKRAKGIMNSLGDRSPIAPFRNISRVFNDHMRH